MSWRLRWTLGGALPVVAYGAWLRGAGLDPPSLWLDDAAVAVLASAPPGDVLAHGMGSPPLLTLAVTASLAVVPDPELGAQLFPFACSLLVILAVSWAALELTRDPICATLAGLLQAADPFAVIYAARVKPYAGDVLVAAVTLALVVRLLRQPTRARLWLAAATAGVGLGLSSVSVFVVAALLPISLLQTWRRAPALRRDALAAAGLLGALALAAFFGFVPGGGNQAVRDWWSAHFLPTDSPGAFLQALGRALYRLPAQVLHELPPRPAAPGLPPLQPGPIPGTGWLGCGLCVAGGAALWLRRQRALLAGLALLLTLVVVASALRRFPLNGGRMELFLTPFVTALLVAGLSLTRRLRQVRWRRLGPLLGLALVLVQVGPVLSARGGLHVPREQTYPRQVSAPWIEHLATTWRPGDLVWSNRDGSHALAFYSGWPVRLRPYPRKGPGFWYSEPQIDGFALLEDLQADAAAPSGARVFVFLANLDPRDVTPQVQRYLATHGYDLVAVEADPSPSRLPPPTLLRFERTP